MPANGIYPAFKLKRYNIHMVISGREIADSILLSCRNRIKALAQRGITPALSVIFLGDDPASRSYISQKQKSAAEIGAQVTLRNLPPDTDRKTFGSIITALNSDRTVHGIIIQRPLPPEASEVRPLLNAVVPGKDVDGFVPESGFEPPVALAVGEILKDIQTSKFKLQSSNEDKLFPWLRTLNIVILGRGETAGEPIADYFRKNNCATSIVHSRTPHPEKNIRSADIVISCVGRERVITDTNIKTGVILISVGIRRDNSGKLRGDYDEAEIQDSAAFYTPTPGGVGPVNVACLMRNLVRASEKPLQVS
ncbi:hypothetical protein A2Z33_01225 [Candidatus Gottesmanbacteria bacterium RBG_16_52_11]|uniref:Bifunctional protein FolD n=1 Tax=Candidatus Gottesmanbacteria bacterium RBG_16_52_11 TaxID=1798374 RepID=A0A1F5YNX8_9BACT|nr:MAG: hypothetical protein A2Z33_01225 [Candidatus Gottesmanbacteria bacterium RBG_16_52_11]